jgi:hypothetical protein
MLRRVMRSLSRVVRSLVVVALCLVVVGWPLPMTPRATAQDAVTGSYSGAFEAGDIGGADALRYAWTITEPGAQWTIELHGPA